MIRELDYFADNVDRELAKKKMSREQFLIFVINLDPKNIKKYKKGKLTYKDIMLTQPSKLMMNIKY